MTLKEEKEIEKELPQEAENKPLEEIAVKAEGDAENKIALEGKRREIIDFMKEGHIYDCGGGGNCGPLSIVAGLAYLGVAKTTEEIREYVARVCNDPSLTLSTTWFNDVHIQHTANFCERNIFVWKIQSVGKVDELQIFVHQPNAELNANTAVLLVHTPNPDHFRVIFPNQLDQEQLKNFRYNYIGVGDFLLNFERGKVEVKEESAQNGVRKNEKNIPHRVSQFRCDSPLPQVESLRLGDLIPDEDQQAICSWVIDGTGSALIEAVAGSGKTKTLLFVMKIVTDSIPIETTELLTMESIVEKGRVYNWVVIRSSTSPGPEIDWMNLHTTLGLPMGRGNNKKMHTPVWIPTYGGWVYKLDKNAFNDGYRLLEEWVNRINNERKSSKPIILYLAFNNNIVKKVQEEQKLSQLSMGIQNATLHKFGKQLIEVQFDKKFKRKKSSIEPNPSLGDNHKKKLRIIEKLLGTIPIPESIDLEKSKQKKRWTELLIRATILAQNFGLSHQDIARIKRNEGEDHPFEEALLNLIGTETFDEIVIGCLEPILLSCQVDKEIDFEDMIWMPVVCDGIKFPKFDWILVDEAQDMNPCQIIFLRKIQIQHPDTRFVIVGDTDQAIYAFRGADPNSLNSLSDALAVNETFTLSGCRRCPISHVALAAHCLIDRDIHATNPEVGTIEFLSTNDIVESLFNSKELNTDELKANLVLCRKNLPLVKLAYSLIHEERGRSVSIVGEYEIGEMLKEFISRFKKQQLPFEEFVKERVSILVGYARKKQLHSRVIFLEEYFNIIMWLFDQSNRNLENMELKIQKLFFTPPSGTTIFFSSTHRSKGDQALNVWVLEAELYLPETYGKEKTPLTYQQKKQELNCLYVTLTRCRGNRLVIGFNDEADNPITNVDDLQERIMKYKTSITEQ